MFSALGNIDFELGPLCYSYLLVKLGGWLGEGGGDGGMRTGGA